MARTRSFAILLMGASFTTTVSARLPSLDDLQGAWVSFNNLVDTPTLSNSVGSVGTLPDVVDATSFIIPPLVSSPSLLQLRVDGRKTELNESRWLPYGTQRRSGPLNVSHHRVVTVESELRMVFGEAGVLWEVTVTSNGLPNEDDETAPVASHVLEFSPAVLARQVESMGWLVPNIPNNPKDFSMHINCPTADDGDDERCSVLHEDTQSVAVSGLIFVDNQPSSCSIPPDEDYPVATLPVRLRHGESVRVRLAAAMGSAGMDELRKRLKRYAEGFDEAWDGAATGWRRLWSSAFGQGLDVYGPFSGRLPVLVTDDENVSRAYYMAVLSLLGTWRVNMEALGRSAFITGFGNTCWTVFGSEVQNLEIQDCLTPSDPRKTGMHPLMIGASAQFYWDTSLRSLLTSLLDPEALRAYLLSVFSLPTPGYQGSFGLDGMTGKPLGYDYSFNALSLFTIISSYIRTTNDTQLLDQYVDATRGRTVGDVMEGLALDWMDLRVENDGEGEDDDGGGAGASSYLADYGGSVLNFLECVPSYLHVVPALQAGNVEMLSWLADLRSQQGNRTGAHRLRSLAMSISREMLDRLYNDGEGFWSCLYPDGPSYVPVRSVVDFIYITKGMHAGGKGPGLPHHVGQEMADFFVRELETHAWLRALSLQDDLNLQDPRPFEITRPDHGVTGAYDAWGALAVDALSALDGGKWDRALALLQKAGRLAKQGPYGQAHETRGRHAFKTRRGYTRHTADNGGSFAETVIRGLFGYEPPFLPQSTSGPEAAILRSRDARGDFKGRLEGLRTPWGDITLESGPDGVKIVSGDVYAVA